MERFIAIFVGTVLIFSGCADKIATDSNDQGTVLIKGVVKTVPEGEEAGIKVSLQGTDYYTFTEGDGRFTLDAPNYGEWTIEAEKSGYRRVAKTVAVSQEESQENEILLVKSASVSGVIEGIRCTTCPGFSYEVTSASGEKDTTDYNKGHIFHIDNLPPGSTWLFIRSLNTSVPFVGWVYVPHLQPGESWAIPSAVSLTQGDWDESTEGEVPKIPSQIRGFVTPVDTDIVILVWRDLDRSLLLGGGKVNERGEWFADYFDSIDGFEYLEAKLVRISFDNKIHTFSSSLMRIDRFEGDPIINLVLSEHTVVEKALMFE